MAGTRKQFKATIPIERRQRADFALDAKGFVTLESDGDKKLNLQVGRYLGKGIDDWVWRCLSEVQEMVTSKSVTTSTALQSWRSGASKLFEFLPAHKPGLQLSDIQRKDVDEFIAWLRVYPTFRSQSSGASSTYGNVKSILVSLQEAGDIEFEGELFPANPFPGSNKNANGAEPLTEAEQGRIERAVRNDVIALHRDPDHLQPADALLVYVLAFALRVGPNTTPLLELKQAELKQHPWVPNMKLLQFVKRRGNSTFVKSLRYSEAVAQNKGVRPDASAIYEILLKNARQLNTEASSSDKGYLLLYRSSAKNHRGKVCRLSDTSLARGFKRFVERHSLVSDAGEVLKLNMSRLRKTRSTNLWELSPDPVAVAAENNHSPAVLNNNYHVVTERMTLNAAKAVESLIPSFREAVGPLSSAKKTPVSRCNDPLNGSHAPKDGSECADFESCLSCDSFALVESLEDLYRFFSYCGTLASRALSHPSAEERQRLAQLLAAVDSHVDRNLDSGLVARAKEAAAANPIRFWRIYDKHD